MPERFRRYETEPWRSRGLRIMSVDNYIVLYSASHNPAVVSIYRIMYGGRDLESRLKEHTKT